MNDTQSLAGSIIYIENFPTTRPIEDLQALFEPFGPIIEISLPSPSKTKISATENIQTQNKSNTKSNKDLKKKNNKFLESKSNVQSKKNAEKEMILNRGFGFVSFEEVEDASHALQNMDKAEFYGQILRVQWATRKHLEGGIPVLEPIESNNMMI